MDSPASNGSKVPMLDHHCRKVTGALKIVHEKYQKTDLYNNFLEQFSDAVTKNEFIEAHLRKASLVGSHTIVVHSTSVDDVLMWIHGTECN